MRPTVAWLLFDLNGTLLDPAERASELKQAVTLAMADTLSGGYRPFGEFLPEPPEPKLFDDVVDGLDELAARYHLAVLTNSAAEEAYERLDATGVVDRFEFIAGTDEVEAFKPHPTVYRHGVERTNAHPDDVTMVTAHPWDILGASRVGLQTAYLAREADWPTMLDEPDWQAPDLRVLAAVLP